MIGVIVAGHGGFAKGMAGAVNLLAGKPEKFLAVDFEQEDTTDDLELKLKDAIWKLGDCRGILIMTDMLEGQPYKISTQLKFKNKGALDIEVVTGTNLGMLSQVNLARGYVNDVNDLADLAVDEGRRQTLKYTED